MSNSKYYVDSTHGAVQAEAINEVNLFYNIYKQYSEGPCSLSANIKYREFHSLVEDRTKDFIGRDFVFEAIDRILDDPKTLSGYIVIRGEPGIGKTAIISELVRRRAYVHHFNVASQNIRSPEDFLLNICSQLILHYGLNYETLPPEAGSDSGFFSTLLAEAVSRTDDNRVVILVDAIDESEDISLPPKSNRLFLPPSLPEGAFIIVSAREEHDMRLCVDHRNDIYLTDDDPQNLQDVVKYICHIIDANKDLFNRQISAWRVSLEEFIDIIKIKSEGNFMYLVYVLRDIQDGKISFDTISDINNLPQGLWSYYQRHWRIMRSTRKDLFDTLHEPIICTLAAVREPVSCSQLMEWVVRYTGISLTPMLIKSVIDDWREFLNVQVTDEGVTLYRLYHTSFQDYLGKEIGLTHYHHNIVQTAFAKIPGSSTVLKEMRSE